MPNTRSGTVSAPACDFDSDGRPNGSAFDVGADEQPGVSGSCALAPPPPPPPPFVAQLYFSTATDFAVPGVTGPFDNADIYAWDFTNFSRVFDASAASLPGNANIDALLVVDSDTFYMSFSRDQGTSVPTLGTVQDEDIVKYDAGTWTWYFDGSGVGLDTNNDEDVDAFEILTDGSVLISTTGNPAPTGSGTPISPTPADEDLLRCVGSFGATTSCTWTMYFEGSDIGLAANSEDVDGVAVSSTNIYFTTLGTFTTTTPATPPAWSGGMEDVWVCDSATTGTASACGSYATFFDGSVNGITDNLDAIDLP